MEITTIYTDGSSKGNPGPGGWAAIIIGDHNAREIGGSESRTTNNRMELTAAIKGLAVLTRSCHIILTTDSQYVRLGITEWLKKWKASGWKTSNKKPVKNSDLWQQLDEEVGRHQKVSWHWVKGHSGHVENEIADQLANKAIDELIQN